jgi:acetyl esterase/lipase
MSRETPRGQNRPGTGWPDVPLAAWLSACLALAALAVSLTAALPAVDAAFAQFWDARTTEEAARAAALVIGSGVRFDEAVSRLKRGRTYAADVARGIVRPTHRIGDTMFPYTLEVPESYDPARRYQVRVQLHGGVMRPEPSPPRNGVGALAGAEQIYVLPASWADAPWWSDVQIENVRVILDAVKRTYNVDENRVALAGVSDGGTATFYFAMRDTTPYASYLSLIGALAVLRNPGNGIEGDLYPHNLLNRPLFVVNGGRDPLYPVSAVEPYVEHLRKNGAEIEFLPQPEGGHNTAWWPEVKSAFERFVSTHPRNPTPDRITWESNLSANTSRAYWLVIDKLAKPAAGTGDMADVNDLPRGSVPNFGIRATGARVTAVVRGSNADSFGLLPGDAIVRVNERSIPPGVNVIDLLSTYEPRSRMTLLVARNNRPVTLNGVFSPVNGPRVEPIFVHRLPSGRVDLIREGNTVRATTRGVAGFTLLLSPDLFDFSKPVKIIANGKVAFDGRARPSVATLMKWAARDNDRTMLFGAEVHVTLER